MWLYQKCGSDAEHFCYQYEQNKAIVVARLDGYAWRKGALKSLKNWNPAPVQIGFSEVPEQAMKRILKHAAKYNIEVVV